MPKSRPQARQQDAGISDPEDLVEKIYLLMARVARVRRAWIEVRRQADMLLATDDDRRSESPEPPENVAPVAPAVLSAERPARPEPRRRGPGRKNQKVLPKEPTPHRPVLVPKPLRATDTHVLCRFGNREITLPLADDNMTLTNGLEATVKRVASTRFRGLAVVATVVIPNGTGRSKRKKQ